MNLLLRFYDPTAGSILLDDVNIRTLNIRWLRAQIGYVGQEPVLLAGSIYDNIAYGIDLKTLRQSSHERNADESDEKILKKMVLAAAKLANAHNFIMTLPQAYDSKVGVNGASLSGGQKQRIAIARALVKRPAILLLDEATSALDSTSERLVQESIDKLQQSRMQTTLVIAHRLSTIRNADMIAVVNNGRVVESGTHNELLLKRGLYCDLIHGGVEVSDETGNEVEKAASFGRGRANSKAKSVQSRSESRESRLIEAFRKPASILGDYSVGEDEAEDLSKARNRLWSMAKQHTVELYIGLGSAAGFGAISPLLGLCFGLMYSVLYVNSATTMKKEAAIIAVGFFILGFGKLLFSVLVHGSLGAVSSHDMIDNSVGICMLKFQSILLILNFFNCVLDVCCITQILKISILGMD